MLLWLYYSAQIFLFGAELTSCVGGLRKPQSAKDAEELKTQQRTLRSKNA
jgi:uncharacterized BrkB/YihY/UPF0761 family membrane protein